MHRFFEQDRPGGGVDYWTLMVEGMNEPFGLLDVTMPFDGELLARVETSGAEHVDRSLDVAYGVFRNRRTWLPLAERIGILERCVRIMSRMQDTLAIIASREGGKPLSDSRIEVQHAIDDAKLCVVHLRTDAGRVAPTGATCESAHRLALIRYEPAGVVVAVGAFNHPLNAVLNGVFAAVAAGCPVIVKPSSDTPLSSLQVAAILRQAGLPGPWCQVVVTADAATAERLVRDGRVGVLSFVGSPAEARTLRSGLAAETRCVLNCGGAAPAFVMQESDALLAIESITRGAYYHAGQIAVSVQRVFVPDYFAREFAVQLAARAANLAVGDPTVVTTEVGPLIAYGEVKRVGEWVDEAVNTGAELMTGGTTIGDSLYRPTVLLNPSADARLSRREILGPVVGVYAYDVLDTAIATANDFAFSAHAAVFSSDLNAALRVFGQLNALATTVNDQASRAIGGMPFAGFGYSGQRDVRSAIDLMRQSKMLVVNSQEL